VAAQSAAAELAVADKPETADKLGAVEQVAVAQLAAKQEAARSLGRSLAAGPG